jgi:hypothetical protein
VAELLKARNKTTTKTVTIKNGDEVKQWTEPVTGPELDGETKHDAVNHPAHYKLPGMDAEAIDVIRAVLGDEGFKAYCHGNVIKYVIRADNKGGVEDLRKARVYLDWEIEAAEPPKEDEE